MSSEVMLFALLFLSGHLRHASLMLLLLGKIGITGGSLKGVAYHFRSSILPYLV
jgi:hypothetical protein